MINEDRDRHLVHLPDPVNAPIVVRRVRGQGIDIPADEVNAIDVDQGLLATRLGVAHGQDLVPVSTGVAGSYRRDFQFVVFINQANFAYNAWALPKALSYNK